MPGSDEERPAAQILAAFKAWCLAEGEPEPRSAKALAADLHALGWAKRKTKQGAMWSRAGAAPEPPRPVPDGMDSDGRELWNAEGYTEEPE